LKRAIAKIGAWLASPYRVFRTASGLDQVALAVTAVFGTWFMLAACWGVLGTPLGGHIGAGHAATALLAEQIVLWKIPYPAFDWFLPTPPVQSAYYCHHPFGMYYISAAFYAVLGHRNVLPALPAVLLSCLTVPLLYAVGKRISGRVGGAIAVAAFSVVPIAVGFANFFNLEVVCMAGTLLAMWGFCAYQENGKKRHLLLSLLGAVIAFSGDWIAYLFIGPMLGFGLLRGFLLRRWMPPVTFSRYATWWAWTSTIAVLLLALFIGLIIKANKLEDLVSSAHGRSGASLATLDATLEARQAWIDFSFTPLAITLGKIAAPFALLRLLIRRRDEEGFSLWILFGALIHYVVFKGGADVHIYWPHYFALYFALSLVQLTATFEFLVRRAIQLFRVSVERALAWAVPVSLFFGMVPVFLMFPDALSALRIWRETGGRYNEKGRVVWSNADLLFVLDRVVKPRLPPTELVSHHSSVRWGWEHDWTYASSRHKEAPEPRADSLYWLARSGGLEAGRCESLAANWHVRAYGDIWLVDSASEKKPLDAFRVTESVPSVWRWYWYGGELVRSVGTTPDPFLTWEWRVHVGQEAPLPPNEATELDDVRILYNARTFAGDGAGAGSARVRIDRELDKTHAVDFPGARLIGTRTLRGVGARIEAWFEATKDDPPGVFSIRSTVESTPWSLIPSDKTVREMATRASIPTSLWRKGFVYVVSAPLYKRIGRERYYGQWGPMTSDLAILK
jgi:hypothetical protein